MVRSDDRNHITVYDDSRLERRQRTVLLWANERCNGATRAGDQRWPPSSQVLAFDAVLADSGRCSGIRFRCAEFAALQCTFASGGAGHHWPVRQERPLRGAQFRCLRCRHPDSDQHPAQRHIPAKGRGANGTGQRSASAHRPRPFFTVAPANSSGHAGPDRECNPRPQGGHEQLQCDCRQPHEIDPADLRLHQPGCRRAVPEFDGERIHGRYHALAHDDFAEDQ